MLQKFKYAVTKTNKFRILDFTSICLVFSKLYGFEKINEAADDEPEIVHPEDKRLFIAKRGSKEDKVICIYNVIKTIL